MMPIDLVKLNGLMERTAGRSEVAVAVIDGPVATSNPDLPAVRTHEVSESGRGACTRADSAACKHGTFVAGILFAKRGSAAPAICPECTLIVRPIFDELTTWSDDVPSAAPHDLGEAILHCIDAGARVINVSAGLAQLSSSSNRSLVEALDHAAAREVIVVAAAGNQGSLGSTSITRHPWVIPVAAYDRSGRPMQSSNFGSSIGRRGLGAPGEGVTSLGVESEQATLTGTSAAAPFVTGAAALLLSEYPDAKAAEVRFALTHAQGSRRTNVVPPLLNAWAAYEAMRR
jgi:subtilisin family serine protease